MVTEVNDTHPIVDTSVEPEEGARQPFGIFYTLRTKPEWRMAVGLGLLAAVIYQAFISGGLSTLFEDKASGSLVPIISGFVTLLLLIVCMAIPVAMYPFKAWRLAFGVAAGPATVVVARIIYDMIFVDPHLHNLFPFEIALVLFMVSGCAIVSVGVGSVVGRLFRHKETAI